MTATCRDACCSVAPRLTVAELFERGFRRNREAPRAIVGTSCSGAEDNTAEFSLDVDDDRIAAVGFHASCCATLIAYCEYIAEIAPGFRLELARGLTATNLVDSVPGVPALKRDRAVLAIAAFRAALLAAANELQHGAPVDESRVHLCHPAP
jgi:NifU-like protein involved in Fe-S cluster formation